MEYDLPVYKFVPVAPAAPAPAAPLLAEGDLDSLVPLLYGNITAGASTLGSAGIRVPGSAGETSEALEASRQIPSLIMADGPAGLRLRQCYRRTAPPARSTAPGCWARSKTAFWKRRPATRAPTPTTSSARRSRWAPPWPRVGTPNLLAQVGRAVSREMDEFHVDLWLAPA